MKFSYPSSLWPPSCFRDLIAYPNKNHAEKTTWIFASELITWNPAKMRFGIQFNLWWNNGHASIYLHWENTTTAKGQQSKTLKIVDAVILRGDESNRGKGPLGVVVNLREGRDGIMRAAKLFAGKSFLERPVQHLYPLELSCDGPGRKKESSNLNPKVRLFRPRRNAEFFKGLRIQYAA